MKKTVYVKAECGFHANREIEELLEILDEYTNIKAKAGKKIHSRDGKGHREICYK